MGTQLGTGKWDEFLRNWLGIKSISTVLPDLASELVATVPLDGAPWDYPDTARDRGWRGFQSYASPGAVAVQYCYHLLSNPAGSGQLAVVQYAYLFGQPTAQTVCIELVLNTVFAVVANHGTRTRLDLENRDATVAQGFCFTNGGASAVAPGYGSLYANQPANGPTQIISGPWIVLPGCTFTMVGSATNAPISTGMRWWERAMSGQEAWERSVT